MTRMEARHPVPLIVAARHEVRAIRAVAQRTP